MDELVSLLSSRTDAANDAAIVQYAKSNVDRLISDWTYAAGTSNHGKYGTYTLSLVRLFEIPTLPRDLAEAISRKIIEGETKVLYRALTMARQAQTIPTISLLKHFAVFVTADVFNHFDFTLNVIPKLMSLQMFREPFLEFYMEMITRSPAQTRRELLANRKVFSGWFGKLGAEDKDEVVIQTLDVLREYVLKDVSTFTKTIKMGIFNDWTLKNLQRLLANPHLPETIIERIHRFVLLLLCDRTYGVKLPGENKLALSFLKIVKPWENTAQMDLVLKLLEESPELQVPYFDNLGVAYPLTPKLSMWWFSYTILHIRTLKLDVPKLKTQPPSSIEFMSKSVLPSTVTRQALQQALTYPESNLVAYQAAQVVLFALRRLRSVIENVFEPNVWDQTPLVEAVLSRLPEPNQFSRSVDQSLLQTTYLIIIKEFCHLGSTPANVQIPLDARPMTGLDLIQAEQILEIQTYTSDQTRWWNANKGESSLFTQLVKFSTFNLQLSTKSSNLLQHLVDPTQLFPEKPTLAHPIDALLFTLSSTFQNQEKSLDIVWDLLEQTIQRVVRSPYQYIDKVNSGDVSPFLVAMLDQYVQHFEDKDSTSFLTKKWLRSFARSLIVLGESQKIIEQLVAPLSIDESSLTSSDEYFDFVLDATDEQLLNRQDLVLKLSNNLELAATLYRIATTTNTTVRNYLFASIPADMLQTLADSQAAFSQFVNGSAELCQVFLTILDGHTSDELREALEKSGNWELALSILSTNFLMTKLKDHDCNIKPQILNELTLRKEVIDQSLISTLIDVAEVAENLDLEQPLSLAAEAGRELLNICKNPRVAAAIVRVSGVYIQSHPLSKTPQVLAAATEYALADVDAQSALEVAKETLKDKQNASAGLRIIAVLSHASSGIELDEQVLSEVSELVERGKGDISNSVLTESFITLANVKPPFLGRWLKVMVHQLARRYAENKMTEESVAFIDSFCVNSVLIAALWDNVHPNAINALLEAALRAEPLPQTFRLVSQISLEEQKRTKGYGSKLTSLGHLTILFENSKPKGFSIEMAIAALSLFRSNPSENAVLEVEQGVLVRYEGSALAKDRVLLQLLYQIEAERQRSWVDHVESWDIRPLISASMQEIDDYEPDALITIKNGSSVFVTLDEQKVRQTTQSFELLESWKVSSDQFDFYQILASAQEYELTLSSKTADMYDSEFLLACVVSCDSLLQNVELMFNSGLLSFVICCLASPSLRDTAIKVLVDLYSKLSETQFKDQVGVKLLVGKILMLNSEVTAEQKPFPSHLPGIVSQLALVLTRPTHFLCEKVCKWLLASPKLQAFDVPLFKAIINNKSEMSSRELLWIVNSLKSSLVDKEAVQFFIRNGVIEWCLSQHNVLATKSTALKLAIEQLMDRIEEVKGGSSRLIKDAGGLAMPHYKQRIFISAGPEEVTAWAK